MQTKVLYFAHGKESGPFGSKIVAMSNIAKSFGYHVESPSYEETKDSSQRVDKLLSIHPKGNPLILVGSSMGAYISTVASKILQPMGLFLLAPAFFRDEYKEQKPKPNAKYVEIVHGWNDELIPAQQIFNYAQEYKVPLHLVASDHRLKTAIPEIIVLFRSFLEKIENEISV